MNAIIMNAQIFHLNKYDLKSHWKTTKVHPILALTQTFPYWMVRWCFPLQIVLISLSQCPSRSLFLLLSSSLFCSMQKIIWTQWNVFHKIKYDLKGHIRPLLCRVIEKKIRSFDKITTLTYVFLDNFWPCLTQNKA